MDHSAKLYSAIWIPEISYKWNKITYMFFKIHETRRAITFQLLNLNASLINAFVDSKNKCNVLAWEMLGNEFN